MSKPLTSIYQQRIWRLFHHPWLGSGLQGTVGYPTEVLRDTEDAVRVMPGKICINQNSRLRCQQYGGRPRPHENLPGDCMKVTCDEVVRFDQGLFPIKRNSVSNAQSFTRLLGDVPTL